MASYVQQQLVHSRLWPALELSERIEKLLAVVTPGEVSFQAGCGPAEVRKLLATALQVRWLEFEIACRDAARPGCANTSLGALPAGIRLPCRPALQLPCASVAMHIKQST